MEHYAVDLEEMEQVAGGKPGSWCLKPRKIWCFL